LIKSAEVSPNFADMKFKLVFIFLIGSLSLGAQTPVSRDSLATDTTQWSQRDSLLRFAEKFQGRPYGFGSVGPSSFDCSGYVQYVYGHFGVKLPHGSVTQSGICKTIKLEDAQPGDLIFFNGRKRNGQIGHVGLVHHWEGKDLYIIHATVQAGVLLESMQASAYFQPRFIKVGRLINGLKNPEIEIEVKQE
jgi:cell wall-associated NlpC family hydrolase